MIHVRRIDMSSSVAAAWMGKVEPELMAALRRMVQEAESWTDAELVASLISLSLSYYIETRKDEESKGDGEEIGEPLPQESHVELPVVQAPPTELPVRFERFIIRKATKQLGRCPLCYSLILTGQSYHDGGVNGQRAHEECVKKQVNLCQ